MLQLASIRCSSAAQHAARRWHPRCSHLGAPGALTPQVWHTGRLCATHPMHPMLQSAHKTMLSQAASPPRPKYHRPPVCGHMLHMSRGASHSGPYWLGVTPVANCALRTCVSSRACVSAGTTVPVAMPWCLVEACDTACIHLQALGQLCSGWRKPYTGIQNAVAAVAYCPMAVLGSLHQSTHVVWCMHDTGPCT